MGRLYRSGATRGTETGSGSNEDFLRNGGKRPSALVLRTYLEKKLDSVTLFRYILAQSKNPSRAQKEAFHNEALLLIDALLAASVEEFGRDEPPQSPEPGACFVVSGSPGGDWSEYPDHLACFTSAGWRYVPPVVGMAVFLKQSGVTAAYGASGWEVGSLRVSQLVIDNVQVVGSQRPAISNPSGGSILDSEARSTLEQVLGALRSHGLIATD